MNEQTTKTIGIPNGIYPAHLAAAQTRLSSNGRQMVEFLWQIDGTDKSIKSFLHLTLADGSPNTRGIAFAKRWASDWDDKNPYWFAEHLNFCRQYAVKLDFPESDWSSALALLRTRVRTYVRGSINTCYY